MCTTGKTRLSGSSRATSPSRSATRPSRRTRDYAFGPRDVPHRFTVGPAGCRMLFICTPGGFEDLVIAMSEPAGSRSLPPPSDEEPDWQRIAAIAEAYGAELLA